jgi:hypothetical protein
MDLSFIRRRRPVTINLHALLARTSAAQGASPTARAQVRLENAARHLHPADPQVALFADDRSSGSSVGQAASFADIAADIFSPRQSS